jgi:hypothetical protein
MTDVVSRTGHCAAEGTCGPNRANYTDPRNRLCSLCAEGFTEWAGDCVTVRNGLSPVWLQIPVFCSSEAEPLPFTCRPFRTPFSLQLFVLVLCVSQCPGVNTGYALLMLVGAWLYGVLLVRANWKVGTAVLPAASTAAGGSAVSPDAAGLSALTATEDAASASTAPATAPAAAQKAPPLSVFMVSCHHSRLESAQPGGRCCCLQAHIPPLACLCVVIPYSTSRKWRCSC